MAIITATELVKSTTYSTTSKATMFTALAKAAILSDEPFVLKLPFRKFGATVEEIQFILDAGYFVTKDLDNEEWVVTIKYKSDLVASEDSPVYDLNILTADQISARMPDETTRKIALYNSYVSQEINKLDVFPFRVYLSFSMFGDKDEDIQFIKDKGLVVTRNTPNETWDITLP